MWGERAQGPNSARGRDVAGLLGPRGTFPASLGLVGLLFCLSLHLQVQLTVQCRDHATPPARQQRRCMHAPGAGRPATWSAAGRAYGCSWEGIWVREGELQEEEVLPRSRPQSAQCTPNVRIRVPNADAECETAGRPVDILLLCKRCAHLRLRWGAEALGCARRSQSSPPQGHPAKGLPQRLGQRPKPRAPAGSHAVGGQKRDASMQPCGWCGWGMAVRPSVGLRDRGRSAVGMCRVRIAAC